MPIDARDHRLDARARLPRRPRQPAREEHVVLRLEALQLRLEEPQLAIDVDLLLGHALILARLLPPKGGSHT